MRTRWIHKNAVKYILLAVAIVIGLGVGQAGAISQPMSLLYPQAPLTEGEQVVVVVKLPESGQQLVEGSLQVIFDGVDVTDRALLQEPLLTYAVPHKLLPGRYVLTVKGLLTDGSTVEKSWTIRVAAAGGGFQFGGRLGIELAGEMKGDDSSGEMTKNLTLRSKWGPLSAQLEVEQPGWFEVEQTEVSGSLGLKTRWLAARVFDIESNLSRLTVAEYPLHGYEVDFHSFLAGVKVLSGKLKDSPYENAVAGLRLRTGLGDWLQIAGNFGKIVESAGSEAEVVEGDLPQQNYAASVRLSSSILGASCGAEAGVSAYFDRAVGSFWEQEEVQEFAADIPPEVKEFFPLPAVSPLSLPEIVDAAAATDLYLPLGPIEISGERYFYGPNYALIGAPYESNRTGYKWSVATEELFEVITLSGEIEQYDTGTVSPLAEVMAQVVDSINQGSQGFSSDINFDNLLKEKGERISRRVGSLTIAPEGRPAVSFSYAGETETPRGSGSQYDVNQSEYSFAVDDLQYQLAGVPAECFFSVTTGSEISEDPQALQLRTAGFSGRTSLELGSSHLTIFGGYEREEKAAGPEEVTLAVPTVGGNIYRRMGDLVMSAGCTFTSRGNGLTADSSQFMAIGDSTLMATARAYYRVRKGMRVVAGYKLTAFRNQIDDSASFTEHEGYIRYSWRF